MNGSPSGQAGPVQAVPQPKVVCLMGMPVHVVDRQACLALLAQDKQQKKTCFLTTPNVNFMATALQDRDFRDSICRSDLVVADGMPLVWVARLLGIPLRERVSGSDLFEDLAKSDEVWRTFFMGGPPGVAEQACQRLSGAGSAIEPVGFFYPGFASVDDMPNEAIVQAVRGARPDLLILALGAVKGQAWISKHLEALPACVVSHLGAVVNFAAGGVSRAPLWVQKSGLEWIWRIKEEPGLWRRYWRDGRTFLAFFLTRSLPLALSLWHERRLARARACAAGESALGMEVDPQGCIRLSGEAVQGPFDRLARLLEERFLQGPEVVLEVSRLQTLDPFFAGFLMITESRGRQMGRRLRLTGLTPRIRRRLRWMGADALLETA